MWSYTIHASVVMAILSTLVQQALAQSIAPAPSRYERSVLLVTEDVPLRPDLDNASFGSAFIVECRDEFFLTTATHIASLCTEQTSVGIASAQLSHWARLSEVVESSAGEFWIDGEHIQVSVARLVDDGANEEFFAAARRISVPIDDLADSVPPRGTHVEIVGFPVATQAVERERTSRASRRSRLRSLRALGYSVLVNENEIGAVTGIAVSTYIATRELFMDEDDVRSAAFLSPTVPRRLAGAPVFLNDRQNLYSECVGLYAGNRSRRDGTESLSAMIPARCVRELIHADAHSSKVRAFEQSE